MKTTEQLVCECFCPARVRTKNKFANDLWRLPRSNKDVLYLARAARRFVKTEDKMLQEKRYNKINRELKKH